MQHHVVYLDYSATTPVDPRVAEKMILTTRPPRLSIPAWPKR